jgi:HEPN domain-containing protein
MTKEEKVTFWLTSADNDWLVAGHLFEKGDYSYALFLAHLTVEKTLKALFVFMRDDVPPFTHRLIYLADKAGVILSDERLELLESVTDFNLEARYPDEKFSFKKRCTLNFTKHYLSKIEELCGWLRQLMS